MLDNVPDSLTHEELEQIRRFRAFLSSRGHRVGVPGSGEQFLLNCVLFSEINGLDPKRFFRCFTAWARIQEAARGQNLSLAIPVPQLDLPRAWDLFSFVLPRAIRARVYQPAHQELLDDYIVSHSRYQTKWARRWLTFAFTVRTALLVTDCLRGMARERGAKSIRWLVVALFGAGAIKHLRGLFFDLFRRL